MIVTIGLAFAGIPETNELSAHDSITTLPAATNEDCPIETPLIMVQLAPI